MYNIQWGQNRTFQCSHFLSKRWIVSYRVWWIRSKSLIVSILAKTCDQDTEEECQFRTVIQWMATKHVFINLWHGTGISRIVVKKMHICTINVSRWPAILDALMAACCQSGLRCLQLQKMWRKEPDSGQPRKHKGDTDGNMVWSLVGVIYHLVCNLMAVSQVDIDLEFLYMFSNISSHSGSENVRLVCNSQLVIGLVFWSKDASLRILYMREITPLSLKVCSQMSSNWVFWVRDDSVYWDKNVVFGDIDHAQMEVYRVRFGVGWMI